MSIIDTIQPTQEEIDLQEVRRCAEYRKGGFEALKSAIIVSFKDIWYNNKITPKDHFDLLAGKGASLFIESSKIQGLIKEIDPDWIFFLPNYEYNIKEDGSVEIGEKLEIDPNYAEGGAWYVEPVEPQENLPNEE